MWLCAFNYPSRFRIFFVRPFRPCVHETFLITVIFIRFDLVQINYIISPPSRQQLVRSERWAHTRITVHVQHNDTYIIRNYYNLPDNEKKNPSINVSTNVVQSKKEVTRTTGHRRDTSWVFFFAVPSTVYALPINFVAVVYTDGVTTLPKPTTTNSPGREIDRRPGRDNISRFIIV